PPPPTGAHSAAPLADKENGPMIPSLASPGSARRAARGQRGAAWRRFAIDAGRLVMTLMLGSGAIQLLEACSFSAPNELRTPEGIYTVLNAAPYANPETVHDDHWRVIDAPKLKVDHGMQCGTAMRAVSEDYIGARVGNSMILPDGFNGTVFLNGWFLKYNNDDHDVAGLGSVIFNIGQIGPKLVWDAGSVISDRDGDDVYTFCYKYTVLAWAKNIQSPVVGVQKPHVDMAAIWPNSSGRGIFVDQGLNGSKIRTRQKFDTGGPLPAARLLNGFGVG